MDDDQSFWKKVKRTAGKLPFVDHAVALYFCMRDPATPLWAKAQILAALAYFVSPVDAIPDFLPVVGYADDAGVVMRTVSLVSAHTTAAHLAAARRWLDG